jgi:hypothetical protein
VVGRDGRLEGAGLLAVDGLVGQQPAHAGAQADRTRVASSSAAFVVNGQAEHLVGRDQAGATSQTTRATIVAVLAAAGAATTTGLERAR